MVVEIFLQKIKQTQNWEDTNQEVTEKSHRKREVKKDKKKLNKERRRLKKGAICGRRDGTETNAHVIERKKGEMIKHLISRWHLYSKLSDTSDKETKISKQNSETDETI